MEAYLTALAGLEGVGPARLRWLLGFGAPSEVWLRVRNGRLPQDARSHLRVNQKLLGSWQSATSKVSPAQWWERCCRAGIGVATIGAPSYPPWLATDIDPPVVLFHRGDPDRVSTVRVAIVGTRRPTGYGLAQAGRLARELSMAGVSVVSGLALGIDAAAHHGVVGDTRSAAAPVAIVGSGLDSPCPRRNHVLAERVAAVGLVLSEVPPGVGASPWRFPVRNRVIAAACDAVVVIESAAKGGSLHTVREALVRDKAVMAVPGPIDSLVSAGTNDLLADGALVCRGTEDVLAAIGHIQPVAALQIAGPVGSTCDESASSDPRQRPLDDRASAVLDALGWRPKTTDALAQSVGMPLMELAVLLMDLEEARWIERRGGWVERVAGTGRVPGSL